MNLFYLDQDIDKLAEYHVDSHVIKMVTEAAQLLTTTVWVDHLLGYIPRKLTSEELLVIKEAKAKEPSIEERTFTRFLPTHINHPCAIWVRSSMDNYEWTHNYCDALNSEYRFRWQRNMDHKSFTAASNLPPVKHLPRLGITERPQCMPEDIKDSDPILAYRMFYMLEKAPFAVWKRREKPYWWDENLAEYMGRDPHKAYLNTVRAPTNKNKLHSKEYSI